MAQVTLVELQELEADLTRAMASGQLQVGYRDKTVRYRDMPEMEKALNFVRQEIAKLDGTPVRARQIRVVTRDGFGNSNDSR